MSDTSDTSNDFAEVFRARIDRLHGESDFYTWKCLVTSHLKRHDLWDVISGATPRPASALASAAVSTPEQELWDSTSRIGIEFLYQYVDATIHSTFELNHPGPAMWAALMRRYYERDAATLLNAFNIVSSLRYTESSAESIPEYLASF